MRVSHSVEDLTPLFACPHETSKAQLAQLVARRRLARIHNSGKIIHTELTCSEECIDHSKTTGISQKLEPLRKVVSIIDTEQILREAMMVVGSIESVCHPAIIYERIVIHSYMRSSICRPQPAGCVAGWLGVDVDGWIVCDALGRSTWSGGFPGANMAPSLYFSPFHGVPGFSP